MLIVSPLHCTKSIIDVLVTISRTMPILTSLLLQPLHVYVFDDTDPEDASYLGLVKVPLIPLAHDKTVKGTFELRLVGKGHVVM